jgi:hypothetical protein
MNHLINELRLNAGISRLDDSITMVAVNKDGTIRNPLDGLEDFAQLIVNECISAIEEAAEDIDNGDIFRNQELLNKFEERWSAGLYYAIEKIQERLQNAKKSVDN